MQKRQLPYKQFGEKLQKIRKNSRESLPEVSGAVELESDIIERYERGETRPSEDVLDLLIRHFDLEDDEADELWNLAGYTGGNPGYTPISNDIANVPNLMVIPMDNRIVYTDTANVTINNYGVVINFMQNNVSNQPSSIARVGMSIEHAKSVLEVLTKTINQAENSQKPKQLPEKTESE